MKCGNCDKADGLCYTSNPPKVKCTITGKFHGYDDECDAIKTIEITAVDNVKICTDCLICGEPVELIDIEVYRLGRGHDVGSKVCEKCRKAIMRFRKWIEDGEYPVTHGDIIGSL